MARRSAGNPRYRKDAALGSTRRSAASAKPKRDAGEAPAKRGSSAGKKGGGKVDWRTTAPDTPEYHRLRRLWFILLMVAIVASLGGYLLRDQQTLGTIALGLAYASLFMAFGIDMLKIKPMRKAWVQQLGGGGPSKVKASEPGAPDVKDSSDEGKA